jgi:hypothetical protein
MMFVEIMETHVAAGMQRIPGGVYHQMIYQTATPSWPEHGEQGR